MHKGDLPKDVKFSGDIAVDTEAMGLNNKRDRLCLVQLSDGNGSVHLVQFEPGKYDAPNLCALLTDPKRVKLFHFARFDVAIIKHYLGVDVAPIYCSKIASRIARTFTDKHGLKELCKDLLGKDISKQQQSSNWGEVQLSDDQIKYAAHDVIYLHQIREKLDSMLAREGRKDLAYTCMETVPLLARLDLMGWDAAELFNH